MQKNSIVMFRNQLEALCGLTSIRDVKLVVRAIIDYGMNGQEVLDMPDHLLFGWNAIKYQIDDVMAHEEEVKSKRTAAASKRWSDDAKACKSMQTMQKHANDAKACKSMQMDAKVCTENHEYINNNNKNNNITQEIYLKKEKENNTKEKKEIANPDDIFGEDTIALPNNYKRWSLDNFTASVDQVITSKPEYQEHREAFIRYWTEPDPKGKMRFSLQRTWLTAGRLATWAKNAGWGSSGNNNNNGNNNNGNNGYNKPGSEGSFGRYTPRNG